MEDQNLRLMEGARDLALRRVDELEREVSGLRELLHVVYREALTLEAWREELPRRMCLRVELAVVDRDAQLSELSRLELAELLARKISERMVACPVGGEVGSVVSLPPLLAASLEGRAADILYRGGKKDPDAE